MGCNTVILFFSAADRCLEFRYAMTDLIDASDPYTEINVYKEGKGMNRTRIFRAIPTSKTYVSLYVFFSLAKIPASRAGHRLRSWNFFLKKIEVELCT